MNLQSKKHMDLSFINNMLQPAALILDNAEVVFSNQHQDQHLPINIELPNGSSLVESLPLSTQDIDKIHQFLVQDAIDHQNILRFMPNGNNSAIGDNYWIKISRLTDYKHFLVEFEPNLAHVSTSSLQRHLEFLEVLIESTPNLVSFIDRSYRYRIVSASYLTAHDLSREQIVGAHVSEVLGPEQFEEKIKPQLDRAFAGYQITYSAWFFFKGHDQNRFCTVNYAPSTDNNNLTQGVLVTVQDKTALKQEAIKYKNKADYDALTTLENRHSFNENMKVIFEQASQNGNKFSVLFIDLDDYKVVNDTHGHQVGDEVLKEAAKRLQRIMRSSDHLARWGGDEFVAVLTTTKSTDEITAIISRIQSIFLSPITVGDVSIEISCSVGASLYPDHGNSIESLLRYADHSMYINKEEKS